MKTIIVRVCSLLSLCFSLLMSQSCLAQFEGKLFTTPEERAYLDALRANFLRESQEQGFDITETGPPPLPEADEEQDEATTAPVEYTLGGILTRSDGTRTVWLNNQPIAESNLPANMKLIANGSQVMLRIGSGANFFQIKPGQTVNMSTGEILEAYQREPTETANSSNAATAIDAEIPAAQLPLDNNPEEAPESAVPKASAEAGTRETP